MMLMTLRTSNLHSVLEDFLSLLLEIFSAARQLRAAGM